MATSRERRRRGRREAPCSHCPPDPSSFPSGETGLLRPGAEVEVRRDGDGYYGTWCEATVVGCCCSSSAPARRYSVTFDGHGSRQFDFDFAPTHVRPRPPPALEPPPRFVPDDIVEVCHHGAWWSGLVLSADRRAVTVAFPVTREVGTFMTHLVRPRRDYTDHGGWVPSRTVVDLRPKCDRRFEVGEEVEVASSGAASVARIIDDFIYVVDYYGGGSKSEYLHSRFIRPARQQSSAGETVVTLDIPLSTLCKSPESTHSPNSFASEKKSPQGSNGIVNSVPMNGLLCASPGHSAPVGNQEILSDMVVTDGGLNGSVSGRKIQLKGNMNFSTPDYFISR